MGQPGSPLPRSGTGLAQGVTAGSLVGGRYRVIRPLKSGGMGSVFEAEHQGTHRRVALKVIHPELVADPEARRRFETEARLSAVLASRHVVDVLDAGIDKATGVPFIAMELLRGCDLEELACSRGRISAEATVTYLEQIARALDRAHSQGIVHRDLKPENLFLANFPDQEPHIKILDFGIAKLLHQYAAANTNQVTGTPLYMAPEQAQRATDISPATDIWALGLIAYRLLVGRAYWEVDTVHALYAAILVYPLGSPTERAKNAGCSLPRGFDAWFFGCVHRDPSQRFKSAGQAVAALAHLYSLPAAGRTNAAPRAHAPYEPVATRAGPLTELGEAAFAPNAPNAFTPTPRYGPVATAAHSPTATAVYGAAPTATYGPAGAVTYGPAATATYGHASAAAQGSVPTAPYGSPPGTIGPAGTHCAEYPGAHSAHLAPGAVHPALVHASRPRRPSPMMVTAILVGTVVAGLLVAVVVVALRSSGIGGSDSSSRGSQEARLGQLAATGQGALGTPGTNATLGSDQPTPVAPLAQAELPSSSYTPLIRYRSPSACPGAYWVQVAAPADATPDNYDFPITRKAIVGRPELAGCCFVMARNPVGRRIFGGIAPSQAAAVRLKDVLDEKIGSHGRAIQSKAGLTILHGTFFLDEMGNAGFFAQPL